GVADSIDHVMPRSRGGMHVWENVTAACRPCNLRACDRPAPHRSGRTASAAMVRVASRRVFMFPSLAWALWEVQAPFRR
ncbi:MAG: HNH endonuclease, partial [Actinobacteria bacterium]|nr:HNH endonuclease [Actinomycetota bacterium]